MRWPSVLERDRLRRERYERVARLVGLRPGDRILELGCGRGSRSVATYNRTNEIVGVDLLEPAQVDVPAQNFRYVQADATDLRAFPDGSFDVVLSFGLLEHLQPRDRLLAAVREAQRVADRYAFVVPHRYAMIEPHFRLPLFAVWPDRLKAALIRRTRLGTQPRRADGRFQRLNWLSEGGWRKVFGDPAVRVDRHWYGPLLLYAIISRGPDRPPRETIDA
jgi:SAM-dependent methyltransferase